MLITPDTSAVTRNDDESGVDDVRITVEASSIEAVAAALDLEPAGEGDDAPEFLPDLEPVLETMADVYRGVQVATEHDSRGRSRKLVREYAGREDLGGTDVGNLLRVLALHGLVAQDGNRWRIPEADG